MKSLDDLKRSAFDGMPEFAGFLPAVASCFTERVIQPIAFSSTFANDEQRVTAMRKAVIEVLPTWLKELANLTGEAFSEEDRKEIRCHVSDWGVEIFSPADVRENVRFVEKQVSEEEKLRRLPISRAEKI